MNNQVDEVPQKNLDEQAQPKRGGCLSAFLIAMFIVNPLLGLVYLFGMEQMRITYPNAPNMIFVALAVLTFFNLLLAIATWNWKKIGVYGFWVSAVLALIINLSLGLLSWTLLLGFLGPIIVTILVKPKWQEFK